MQHLVPAIFDKTFVLEYMIKVDLNTTKSNYLNVGRDYN